MEQKRRIIISLTHLEASYPVSTSSAFIGVCLSLQKSICKNISVLYAHCCCEARASVPGGREIITFSDPCI